MIHVSQIIDVLRKLSLLEELEEVLNGSVGGQDHRYDPERTIRSSSIGVSLSWSSTEQGEEILQSVCT